MNRINDLRAEWVRARAYRITVWAWPVMALAALGFAAFGVLAIRDALAAGSSVVSQVETLAYLPGGASGVSGLLVAILATTLVTADESSGTARQLRMVVSDTRLLASRLSVVVLLAVAATVVSAAAGLGVAAATLPSALLVATLASTVLWVNIFGTLLVHATWGLLAFAAASLVPRSASSAPTTTSASPSPSPRWGTPSTASPAPACASTRPATWSDGLRCTTASP